MIFLWTWSLCHHFLVWCVWLYLLAAATSNTPSSLILYCSPWSEPRHGHCASLVSLITVLHPECLLQSVLHHLFEFILFCKHFHPETTLTNYQCVSVVGHLSLNHTDTCWCTEPTVLLVNTGELIWYHARNESCPKSVLPYQFTNKVFVLQLERKK